MTLPVKGECPAQVLEAERTSRLRPKEIEVAAADLVVGLMAAMAAVCECI